MSNIKLLRYWPRDPLICDDCGSTNVILDSKTHDYVCRDCGLVYSRVLYAEKRMLFHTEPLSKASQDFEFADIRLARFYNRNDERGI